MGVYDVHDLLFDVLFLCECVYHWLCRLGASAFRLGEGGRGRGTIRILAGGGRVLQDIGTVRVMSLNRAWRRRVDETRRDVMCILQTSRTALPLCAWAARPFVIPVTSSATEGRGETR